MNTDNHVRVVLWMPKALYAALKQAAADADVAMPDELRARLASSLSASSALVEDVPFAETNLARRSA